MSIFLNKDNKVIVQGITGGEGTKHTALMLKAGTNVVGGVNARKAGTTVSHVDADGNNIELPVFASVEEAIKETGGRHLDRLRAAEVLQGRHHRGDRRGDPAAGRHHRGHPSAGQRLRVGLQPGEGREDPHHRSELPRHHHPRVRHWSASRRTTSPARARSVWSPSPAP